MCAIAANYRAAKSELKAKLDAAGWAALGGSRARQGRTGVSIRSCPELILADINAKWRHHLKRINTARQRIWICMFLYVHVHMHMYMYVSRSLSGLSSCRRRQQSINNIRKDCQR